MRERLGDCAGEELMTPEELRTAASGASFEPRFEFVRQIIIDNADKLAEAEDFEETLGHLVAVSMHNKTLEEIAMERLGLTLEEIAMERLGLVREEQN